MQRTCRFFEACDETKLAEARRHAVAPEAIVPAAVHPYDRAPSQGVGGDWCWNPKLGASLTAWRHCPFGETGAFSACEGYEALEAEPLAAVACAATILVLDRARYGLGVVEARVLRYQADAPGDTLPEPSADLEVLHAWNSLAHAGQDFDAVTATGFAAVVAEHEARAGVAARPLVLSTRPSYFASLGADACAS